MTLFGSVKTSCFEKFLKSLDCAGPIQGKGDHIKYKCPGCFRTIIFRSTKEIPEIHIRTNLSSLGISVNDFLKFKEHYC